MRTRVASALLLALVAASALAGSRAIVAGQTFPIAEPDVLEEIKAKAQSTDWQRWMRRAPADYGAFRSKELPRATQDESRLFDPTYNLPDDIRDQNGKVLFPKGFPINVYTRIQVPGRYIVIGDREEDFRWLREIARPQAADKVLIAGGNALLVRQQRRVPVYVLEDRFIERFGLRAIPAIVQQEGTQLRVREFFVPPLAHGAAVGPSVDANAILGLDPS